MARYKRYRGRGRGGRFGGMKGMLSPIVSGVADSYLDPMLPIDGVGATLVGGFLMHNSTMKDLGLYKIGFSLGNILPLPRLGGSYTGGGNIAGGGFLQMAATTATLFAIGMQTGQGYSVDCAVPDAVATQWTFDDGAGASTTSPAWYTFPEDVMVKDISMAAAPTATRGRFTANGVPAASVIRYVSHLYSLNNRPSLNIKVKAGTRLGIVQL